MSNFTRRAASPAACSPPGLWRRCSFAAAGAQAADYDVGPIHIGEPWARATPKGASSGAGYLTVTNAGTAPDR